MTMNESSPPCEQRCLTFNDHGQSALWLDPSYQRHITFACTGCYQLHPHHHPGIVTPDNAGTNLPTPKGWIAWLVKADCMHISFA